jgi:hypothetical protein
VEYDVAGIDGVASTIISPYLPVEIELHNPETAIHFAEGDPLSTGTDGKWSPRH